MPDQIFIRNLEIHAILGVLPEERTTPQTVRVNVTLDTDTRSAAASRALADTIDYAALAEAITRLTEDAAHLLVETLAEDIAGLALADQRVRGVTVEVSKPEALAAADAVGVSIYRERST